jgi:hypothetical protein
MARIASERSSAAQTDLSKTGKRENQKGFLEDMSVKVLTLLALPDARPAELIHALADPEQSECV